MRRSSIENYEDSKKSYIKTAGYICKICGLKFRYNQSFRDHEKEHKISRREK
jgi:hypothetical protein